MILLSNNNAIVIVIYSVMHTFSWSSLLTLNESNNNINTIKLSTDKHNSKKYPDINSIPLAVPLLYDNAAANPIAAVNNANVFIKSDL